MDEYPKDTNTTVSAIIEMLHKQNSMIFIRKATPIINELLRRNTEDVSMLIAVFNYGYILGKRAERERRKGGKCNA